MEATKQNGSAKDALTAPLSVVPVSIPDDKALVKFTVTLEQLTAKNIEVARAEQVSVRSTAKAKSAAAQAQIDASSLEVVRSEYQDMLLTYKIEHKKPLDRGIHLVTGESVTPTP